MTLNFDGLILGVFTFLIIGIAHPIVIKTEYYFGTRPWWIFLLFGLVTLAAALLTEDIIPATMLGVTSFSSFWAIKELFEQRERVRKGWFPCNPRRKSEYGFTEVTETPEKVQKKQQ